MNSEAKKSGSYVFELIKALIISIIISLVLILLGALIIKLFNLNDNIIPVINQIIKSVSILVAVLIAFKQPNNGWVRGIVMGLLYTAVSFVIFSLFNNKFVFGLNILNDLAIGCVTGMISGIIAANFKRKPASI